MTLPRFRVRTLMIAIAVFAPVLAAEVFILQYDWAMDDFYGPRGFLAREHELSWTITSGDACLSQGRWSEAEATFRRALKLSVEHASRSIPGQRTGWGDAHCSIGLAEAMAEQGRVAEAAPLYRKAVADIEKDTGPEDTALDAYLMRYAKFLRDVGRVAEAEGREAQAVAALDRSASHFRQKGRAEVSDALEARARAIRALPANSPEKVTADTSDTEKTATLPRPE